MMEHLPENKEQEPQAVRELRSIFNANKDKRISVVGGSCVGKTTLMKYFPEAVDMDDILFGNEEKNIPATLTQKEMDYVCSPNWTPEIGNFMTEKAKELIRVEAGKPVFGTIVFDSDLIVEITVPEHLYAGRIQNREACKEGVVRMKDQIDRDIEASGIPKIVVENI